MVFLPGGIGTFDELFALETHHKLRSWDTDELISPFHVILVGKAYWGALQDAMLSMMGTSVDENNVNSAESKRGAMLVQKWRVVDTAAEFKMSLAIVSKG